MHDRRPPPSAGTLVGMGAIEEVRPLPREEAISPPHGTSDPLRAGDVALLLSELRRLEEKQDATLLDVRALAREVREVREVGTRDRKSVV